jgi:hypothetical protein
MEKHDVVIVGGGVSGLVAGHVFSTRGCSAIVLEPNSLGGDFLAGGLKYIHRTSAMEKLFDELLLPWSDYQVNGGIMLRGGVRPYPKCLVEMTPEESQRIQADHFRKTRRTEPTKFGSKSMNDPGSAKTSRRAIRCDFEDMVKALAGFSEIIGHGLKQIVSKQNQILLDDGTWIEYKYLILTIPLWVIRQMSDFYVPQGMAMSLNLLHIIPNHDRYARWDYVYTPYTPGDAVHRFSPSGLDGYSVEVNGEWERQQPGTYDDLAFLFSDGFQIRSLKTGIKGHLLDLQEKPQWPENVAPLGRFAQWDPRATTDVTLVAAQRLADRWGYHE